MKIPSGANIARNKLTEYLLRFREKDDKSAYLATAGFTGDNPDDLESAIRLATASVDAILDRQNQFGSFYVLHASLTGPNGRELRVRIVWHQHIDGAYHFVTLYPDKE